jgi:hypothetical protein
MDETQASYWNFREIKDLKKVIEVGRVSTFSVLKIS